MSSPVLLTRPFAQSQSLAQMVEASGGQALLCPLIETVPLLSSLDRVKLSEDIRQSEQIVFTSQNAVKFFFDILESSDLNSLKEKTFFCVGGKTAQSVKNNGYKNIETPQNAHAQEELLDYLKRHYKKEELICVWPRSKSSRKFLEENFSEIGKSLTCINIYDSKTYEASRETLKEHLMKNEEMWCTFFSPSAVHAFIELGGQSYLSSSHRIAAFGRITNQALKESGIKTDLVSKDVDVRIFLKQLR